MATTQDILDAADKLGKLIAEHDATQKLSALLKKLEDDTDAQRLIADLNRHSQSLEEKSQQNKPIEVEDKKKLQELQQQVAGNAVLRDMQLVQMDYLDLMRKVDQKIAAKSGVGGG